MARLNKFQRCRTQGAWSPPDDLEQRFIVTFYTSCHLPAYVVLAVMDKNACRYSFALTGQVDEDETGVLSHGSGD